MDLAFNNTSSEMHENIKNSVEKPETTPFLYAKAMVLSLMNFNVVPNETITKGASGKVMEINEKIMPFREAITKTKNVDEMITILNDFKQDFHQDSAELFSLNKNHSSPLIMAFYNKINEFENPKILIEQQIQMFEDKKRAGEAVGVPHKEEVLLKVGKPICFQDGYEDFKNRVNHISHKYGMSHIMLKDLSPGNINLNNTLDKVDKNAEDFAKRMGMPNEAVGLNGQVAFAIEPSSSLYGGYFCPQNNLIMLPQSFGETTIAHEWMHAVDFIVCDDAYRYVKMKNKYSEHKIDLPIKSHVSKDSFSLPLDGSKELFRYSKLRSFSANVLSGDVNKFDSKVFTVEKKAAEEFFKVGLKSMYFTLTDDVKKELLSEIGIMLVKKKVNFVSDSIASQDIEDFMSDILNKAGVSYDKDDLAVFAYSETEKFHKIQKQFSSVMEFSATGDSDLVKNSRNYDAFLNFKSRINSFKGVKKSKAHSFLYPKDYFRSNTEVLARYLESQLYPVTTAGLNSQNPVGGEVYSKKIDKNFDFFRKELLTSLVGFSNVKAMKLPEMETSKDWSSFSDKFKKSGKSKLNVVATKSFVKLLGTAALIVERVQKAKDSKYYQLANENISINSSLVSDNHLETKSVLSHRKKWI